jgi:hypothetical protein
MENVKHPVSCLEEVAGGTFRKDRQCSNAIVFSGARGAGLGDGWELKHSARGTQLHDWLQKKPNILETMASPIT